MALDEISCAEKEAVILPSPEVGSTFVCRTIGVLTLAIAELMFHANVHAADQQDNRPNVYDAHPAWNEPEEIALRKIREGSIDTVIMYMSHRSHSVRIAASSALRIRGTNELHKNRALPAWLNRLQPQRIPGKNMMQRIRLEHGADLDVPLETAYRLSGLLQEMDRAETYEPIIPTRIEMPDEYKPIHEVLRYMEKALGHQIDLDEGQRNLSGERVRIPSGNMWEQISNVRFGKGLKLGLEKSGPDGIHVRAVKANEVFSKAKDGCFAQLQLTDGKFKFALEPRADVCDWSVKGMRIYFGGVPIHFNQTLTPMNREFCTIPNQVVAGAQITRAEIDVEFSYSANRRFVFVDLEREHTFESDGRTFVLEPVLRESDGRYLVSLDMPEFIESRNIRDRVRCVASDDEGYIRVEKANPRGAEYHWETERKPKTLLFYIPKNTEREDCATGKQTFVFDSADLQDAPIIPRHKEDRTEEN